MCGFSRASVRCAFYISIKKKKKNLKSMIAQQIKSAMTLYDNLCFNWYNANTGILKSFGNKAVETRRWKKCDGQFSSVIHCHTPL